ncbi:porin family protein [Parafilimonas sp.]|uniref:porin family protein n=1 Tax=Parafilimonas sp. TaxID=1969739 RepID=UPI0039E438FD
MLHFFRRKELLCFLLLCTSFTVKAQFRIGIEGGFNKNYLVTNNANRAFTNYKPLYGFSIGVPVQYEIADWFSIAADPSFIQKNYRLERSDFYAGVYQDNTNSYLQLPLMGHFMFGGEKLKGFFNAGLFGGYWMSSHIKGRLANILDPVDDVTTSGSIFSYSNEYNYDEKYSFDKTKDNRFEAGWIGGAGISYQVTDRYQVFAEARYLYGFTDQQKKYETNQVPRYNSTAGINIGLLVDLSGESYY